MILRYRLPTGEQKEHKLTEQSIIIGRSGDVDISIPDKMASRMHCGISYWDKNYFIRDFKSRNGTFVNDKLVEVSQLNPGDRIRTGDTVINVEHSNASKGTNTALMELKDAMAHGKGYHTILHEIIDEDGKT